MHQVDYNLKRTVREEWKVVRQMRRSDEHFESDLCSQGKDCNVEGKLPRATKGSCLAAIGIDSAVCLHHK